MFHVSTYLPYDAYDPQQIPRKKYIGNDLVTIVFLYVVFPSSPSTNLSAVLVLVH
jgi:hypothetical protein